MVGSGTCVIAVGCVLSVPGSAVTTVVITSGGCVGSGVVVMTTDCVMTIGGSVGSGVVVMICVMTIGGEVTIMGCGVPASTTAVGGGGSVMICVITMGGEVTTTVTTTGSCDGSGDPTTGNGVTVGEIVSDGNSVGVISVGWIGVSVGGTLTGTSVVGITPGVGVSPPAVGASVGGTTGVPTTAAPVPPGAVGSIGDVSRERKQPARASANTLNINVRAKIRVMFPYPPRGVIKVMSEVVYPDLRSIAS